MKTLFRILFFLSVYNASAQIVFCPPGAEWRYSVFVFGQMNDDIETIKYTGDSIVGTDTVKVLKHTRFYKADNYPLNMKLSFIKQIGNKVLLKNLITKNTWQTLYDFDALPGQSWISNILKPCDASNTVTTLYTVIVDSVKNTTVNGINLKQLVVKYWSQQSVLPLGYEKVTITERFGANRFLFNFFCSASWSDGDILRAPLCYKDNAFSSIQFSSVNCDGTNLGLTQNTYQNFDFQIFPNPSNRMIGIHSDSKMLDEDVVISIKDLFGREVKRLKWHSEKNEIDIDQLSNGIYLLSISSKQKVYESIKLIKVD
jgi:hypothetical protein